ncbi:uncharacterized protein K02A2.6-like [Notechis scutatus]|uniref:Gypsy retrotransposon integrase-like protein 1 n=1 Tax=Notechis scutatus TaxID=8663 RepID=A0A6J1U611_9SAUR|nr:uncharacterized protein K02A2.6-like [Notechis scutatus]
MKKRTSTDSKRKETGVSGGVVSQGYSAPGAGVTILRQTAGFLMRSADIVTKGGTSLESAVSNETTAPDSQTAAAEDETAPPPQARDRQDESQWSRDGRNRRNGENRQREETHQTVIIGHSSSWDARKCLLWGDRVVIPGKLQERVLELLHEGHPGIVKTKALARSYAWWPGMDRQIEASVATCRQCQASRPSPPAAPILEWETPRGPWSRIHIDFAEPTKGHTFLVTVDAYSNWLEVSNMKTTTTEAVTKELNRLFSTHGLPDVIVSDNGPQFTSLEFEKFLAERGIRLIQHITPNTTTNKSPAELLMGRKLMSPLDRLHPTYNPEKNPDSSSKHRTFAPGDSVYAKNLTGDPLWVPATITQVTGPRSYQLQTTNRRAWKRHIDQLRSRTNTGKTTDTQAHTEKETTGGRGNPNTSQEGRENPGNQNKQTQQERIQEYSPTKTGADEQLEASPGRNSQASSTSPERPGGSNKASSSTNPICNISSIMLVMMEQWLPSSYWGHPLIIAIEKALSSLVNFAWAGRKAGRIMANPLCKVPTMKALSECGHHQAT